MSQNLKDRPSFRWILLQDFLKKISKLVIFYNIKINWFCKDNISELELIFGLFEGVSARNKIIKSDAEGPYVCLSSSYFVILCLWLEHLWRVKHFGAHVIFEAIVFLLEKSTNSEIDENCLVIMVDHDVVRLDVSMNYFYGLVAIVESFKHVYEIQLNIL